MSDSQPVDNTPPADLESHAEPVSTALSSRGTAPFALLLAVLLQAGFFTDTINLHFNLNAGASSLSIPINLPLAGLFAWVAYAASTLHLVGDRLTVTRLGRIHTYRLHDMQECRLVLLHIYSLRISTTQSPSRRFYFARPVRASLRNLLRLEPAETPDILHLREFAYLNRLAQCHQAHP